MKSFMLIFGELDVGQVAGIDDEMVNALWSSMNDGDFFGNPCSL